MADPSVLKRRDCHVTVADCHVTDKSHLRHFFSIREYFGGESNFPVVERLNKGLMCTPSPTHQTPSMVLGSIHPMTGRSDKPGD
eukprot:9218798-Pyramimonas_sp.AAC.1